MKKLEELYDYCVENKTRSPRNIKGGIIRSYFVSPFAVYCDFFVSETEKDPPTNFGNLLIFWGKKLEEQYIDSISPEIRKREYYYNNEGFKEFLNDCFSGREYIYNPPLFFFKEDLEGKPDLLIKDTSHTSIFGDYHYKITEIKFSSQFEKPDKKYYLFQAIYYNYLLGKIQSYTPLTVKMVDRKGQISEFQYSKYEKELIEAIEYIKKIREGLIVPDPVFNTSDKAYWNNYCNQKAMENQDISIITELSTRIRNGMIQKGIRTVKDLSKLSEKEIGEFKYVGQKAKSFKIHCEAILNNKYILIKEAPFSDLKYDNILFLDVEDTGAVNPDVSHFVYLTGTVVRKDGKDEYIKYIAESESEEEDILIEFCDYLSKLESYKIYYWSSKERSEFKKLFEKYEIKNYSFDEFLQNSEDLREKIKEFVCFPVQSYSIKEIGKFLGFKWAQKDVDAMESMYLYFKFLEDGNNEHLDKIVEYNKNDCEAMVVVYDWLNNLK